MMRTIRSETDSVYLSKSNDKETVMLHAWYLAIIHFMRP